MHPWEMPEDEMLRHERRVAMIAYGLFAIAVLGFWVPSIAGVVINYLKVHETPALYASHHRWMIRTFWGGLLWLIVGLVTLVIIVGYLILAALVVWWIYRVLRGWLALYENRPVQASGFLP